ncbi:hypothetical protein [Halomarina litorea]|uniref:hypothetical protein n=1 Tax=Halomarina litorea TaxID=2961595 RepID=UPI0020C43F56|nr:hypothetical protein [Halomarina sp. BCD28]
MFEVSRQPAARPTLTGGLVGATGVLVLATVLTAPLGVRHPLTLPVQFLAASSLLAATVTLVRTLPVTTSDHVGTVTTGVGAVLLLVYSAVGLAGLNEFGSASLLAVGLGRLSLAVGAPSLGYWLYRTDVLGRPGALALGAALPAGVVLTVLLDVLAVTPLGVTISAVGLAGLALYGLGWCAVGVRLAARTPQG